MLPDMQEIIDRQQQGKTLAEIARELGRPYGDVAVAVLAWLRRGKHDG